MPPVGNEDASGSPWISSLPEKPATEWPLRSGSKNESCFSAVSPVSGWKTCVKCVQPISSAHSFIASATSSASETSSGSPASSVAASFLYVSFDRRSRWMSPEKTLAPNGMPSSSVRFVCPRASSEGLQVPALTLCLRARVTAVMRFASPRI